MEILSNRVNEIIETINADPNNCKNDLAKISNVYRWICDNLHYDDFNLVRAKIERDQDKQNKGKIVGVDANHTIVYDYGKKVAKYRYGEISSSYISLLKGKGICVGISNVFNLMGSSMGYVIEPCRCKGGKGNFDNDKFTISNHQMSKMTLRVNGGDAIYYFDPTWDVGKDESRYFCLTRKEVEVSHQLTLADSDVRNGQSLHYDMFYKGLLKSRYEGHKNCRRKNLVKAKINKVSKNVYIKGKEYIDKKKEKKINNNKDDKLNLLDEFNKFS